MRPISAAAKAGALGRLATPPGLCATCRHLELVESPRSVFVRCALARDDPRFPRYPPLPVLECDGYRRATGSGEPGR